MPEFKTEVRIKDVGGAPTPDPLELFVLNLGRGKGKPEKVKLTFYNDTQKKVHVALAEEGVLDAKEFPIEPNSHNNPHVVNECPKGKHNYSVHYENEAPPNSEPKIIVDPDTPS